MNKNTAHNLWFLAAICFIIVGIVNKNIIYLILGCSYVCIGSSIKKEDEHKNKNKNKER